MAAPALATLSNTQTTQAKKSASQNENDASNPGISFSSVLKKTNAQENSASNVQDSAPTEKPSIALNKNDDASAAKQEDKVTDAASDTNATITAMTANTDPNLLAALNIMQTVQSAGNNPPNVGVAAPTNDEAAVIGPQANTTNVVSLATPTTASLEAELGQQPMNIEAANGQSPAANPANEAGGTFSNVLAGNAKQTDMEETINLGADKFIEKMSLLDESTSRAKVGAASNAQASNTQPNLDYNTAVQANTAGQTSAQPAMKASETYTVASHVHSPQFANNAAQTMHLAINSKVQQAEIRMTPENMGPIQLQIKINGTDVSLAIAVQQPDTKQAIELSLPKLREMLADSGMNLGQTNLSQDMSGWQANRDSQQQAEPSGQSGRGWQTDHESELTPIVMMRPNLRSDRMLDLYA